MTWIAEEPGYEETLDQLMKLTKDHIDQAVWLIWAIAQRASVDLNIEASIQSVLEYCNRFNIH
jgi:hypothetical protein